MLSDIFSNAHSRQNAEKLTEITFEGSCLVNSRNFIQAVK